jgi:hypothetical protein
MFEHLGEKRSVAAWAKKLDIPIEELLQSLENGRTIGEIEAEYRDAALPLAA